jgi:starch synthase (maltosyl-transferring)
VADFCDLRAGFPRDRLCVIPNGIDVDAYPDGRRLSPGQVGLPDDRRVLLYIGRLHRQKAVDWLIRIAPRLFARLPQHDLVLAGEGPERAELERLVGQLGIAGRVRFIGYRTDVPDLLAAADLLVLPSRWEGMPNVVLEAMASGRPVVATKAAGVVELLGPLAERQTVDFGDDDAFVQKIADLAGLSDAASELGPANRHRAAKHFSLQRMLHAYNQQWGQVLTYNL